MKGSIRFILGFFLVMGGVGGMETSAELFPLDSLAIVVVGLISMISGGIAINKEYDYE